MRIDIYLIAVCICGVTRTTRRSGCTIPEVLRPFSGNFQIMCLRCTASKAHHLVFGCYIINERRDVICEVTVLDMHRSCDLLV